MYGQQTLTKTPPTSPRMVDAQVSGISKAEVDRLLDQVAASVQSACERINTARRTIEQFADGILGSRPEANGGCGAQTTGPRPRGDIIRSDLVTMHETLGELENEIRRLNAI